MAVTITTVAAEFIGNGVTTIFPVAFSVLEEGHLRVSVDDAWLVRGQDFEVHGEGMGEGACEVHFAVPPAGGSKIRIVRVVPITQLIRWRQQGPFTPEMWERATDLLTMICQQLNAGAIDVSDIFPGNAQNLGNGVGLYDSRVGMTLRFRSLRNDDGTLSLTLDGQTVVVNSNGMVRTSTDQTIDGSKTFVKPVTADAFVKTGGSSSQFLMADGDVTSLSEDAPKAVGAAADPGTSHEPPRADHVHPHGDLPGGSLHSTATASSPGFMSTQQVQTLTSHSASLLNHSGRIGAIEVRIIEAEYTWDPVNSEYVRQGFYDMNEFLPETADSPGPGVVEIKYQHGGMPWTEYGVQVTAGPGVTTSQPLAVSYDSRDEFGVHLHFRSSDVVERPKHFSIRIGVFE